MNIVENCPFCGEKENLDTIDVPHNWMTEDKEEFNGGKYFRQNRMYWVRCSSCQAVGPHTGVGCLMAWRKWNTRHEFIGENHLD